MLLTSCTERIRSPVGRIAVLVLRETNGQTRKRKQRGSRNRRGCLQVPVRRPSTNSAPVASRSKDGPGKSFHYPERKTGTFLQNQKPRACRARTTGFPSASA